MDRRTYKGILEELNFYKNESNLDDKDKEKANRMIKILESTCKFDSIIHNKYINNALNSLKLTIETKINSLNDRKNEIVSKSNNYSFDFGSKEIEEINYKIKNYLNLLNELEYLYICELEKDTSYNENDALNIYNECVESIKSQRNEPIKFYGRELAEYTFLNDKTVPKFFEYISDIEIVSKIYNYITADSENLDITTNIVNIGCDIDLYLKKISRLNFVKNNIKYIDLYNRLQESTKKDINYIIEKSTICDTYKEKMSNRNKNRILKRKAFDFFYSSTLNSIQTLESRIDKRYFEQLKKEKQLDKYRKYFEKNNFNENDIINCAWLDIDTINSEINKYNRLIEDKNVILQTYIDELNKDNNEFFNNYETVKNIILYICNNNSNKLSIYIMYLINNMIEIIDSNVKKDNYDDYMTNDVIRNFKETVNKKIIEIDSYGKEKVKIKTR